MRARNRGLYYVSSCALSSRASSTSPGHFRMRPSSVVHLLSTKEKSAVERQCSSTQLMLDMITHMECQCSST